MTVGLDQVIVCRPNIEYLPSIFRLYQSPGSRSVSSSSHMTPSKNGRLEDSPNNTQLSKRRVSDNFGLVKKFSARLLFAKVGTFFVRHRSPIRIRSCLKPLKTVPFLYKVFQLQSIAQ